MEKTDVLDLDVSIANYIYKGIKRYIKENEKASFPTAPTYKDISVDNFAGRVKRWHTELNELADKFNKLAKSRYPNVAKEEIADAFDSLKQVYLNLWI